MNILVSSLQIYTYIYIFIARLPQDKKSADKAMKSKTKKSDLLIKAKKLKKITVSQKLSPIHWSLLMIMYVIISMYM